MWVCVCALCISHRHQQQSPSAINTIVIARFDHWEYKASKQSNDWTKEWASKQRGRHADRQLSKPYMRAAKKVEMTEQPHMCWWQKIPPVIRIHVDVESKYTSMHYTTFYPHSLVCQHNSKYRHSRHSFIHSNISFFTLFSPHSLIHSSPFVYLSLFTHKFCPSRVFLLLHFGASVRSLHSHLLLIFLFWFGTLTLTANNTFEIA